MKLKNNQILSLFNFGTKGGVLKRSIAGTGIFKITSMIVSFITVPVVLNMLGQQSYGIWLILSSVFNWIMYFDIGLGSGLRNKFSESMATGEIKKAKHFVSTAYVIIGLISISFIIIFFMINPFLNWNILLNTSEISSKILNTVVMIIFPLFCLQFLLRLIRSILIGDQKSSIDQLLTLLTSSGILIAVLVSSYYYSTIDLLTISIIYSASPVIIMFFATIYFFSIHYKNVMPSISYVRKDYIHVIGSLGFKFFVIQICGLITVATSNIIIAHLFSPEDVVPYNLAYKYFFYIHAMFGLIINPLYGAFSNAFANKNNNWIRELIKKINIMSAITIFIIIIMVTISPIFFRFWIGEELVIPLKLVAFMGIYFSITISMTVYAVFISSIGALKISFLISVLNAFLHIPLAILFCKYFGVIGIVIAMIVLSLSGFYWLPLQTKKLLNGSAKGIWATA